MLREISRVRRAARGDRDQRDRGNRHRRALRLSSCANLWMIAKTTVNAIRARHLCDVIAVKQDTEQADRVVEHFRGTFNCRST